MWLLKLLIKGLQYFPQDQEVRNGFKTSKNPINTPLKIKKRGLEKKGRKKKN
jgi:hypothetical protein